MLKKILLGLFSLKFFAVLGTLFGKWVLALPIGGFFLYLLYQIGLRLPPKVENKEESTWKTKDADLYVATGNWGYGD